MWVIGALHWVGDSGCALRVRRPVARCTFQRRLHCTCLQVGCQVAGTLVVAGWVTLLPTAVVGPQYDEEGSLVYDLPSISRHYIMGGRLFLGEGEGGGHVIRLQRVHMLPDMSCDHVQCSAARACQLGGRLVHLCRRMCGAVTQCMHLNQYPPVLPVPLTYVSPLADLFTTIPFDWCATHCWGGRDMKPCMLGLV